MTMIKKINFILAAIMLTISFSAATISCKHTEESEDVEAYEEAEQVIDAANDMERAEIEGRNAAREFVGKNLPDTMSIQQALLDVKSRQSKYTLKNKSRESAAFDSAFVRTLKTVRPDIARELTTGNPDAK